MSKIDFSKVITKAQKDAEKAEREATEYQRLRAPEYPPMEMYLDGIVKGDIS